MCLVLVLGFGPSRLFVSPIQAEHDFWLDNRKQPSRRKLQRVQNSRFRLVQRPGVQLILSRAVCARLTEGALAAGWVGVTPPCTRVEQSRCMPCRPPPRRWRDRRNTNRGSSPPFRSRRERSCGPGVARALRCVHLLAAAFLILGAHAARSGRKASRGAGAGVRYASRTVPRLHQQTTHRWYDVFRLPRS